MLEQLIPDIKLAPSEFDMLAQVLGHPLVKQYIKSLQGPVARDILSAAKAEGETREEFYLRIERAKGIIEGLELLLTIKPAEQPQQPTQ